MAMQELGEIHKMEDIRNIWRYEDRNFTVWMKDDANLKLLGDSLGLVLESAGREVPVGQYRLDLLAREKGSGRNVAIENQLEWSDHSHLGQLLTYAAGRQAQILIWVAPHFTDQHREAINWLNQWTQREIECYAVEIHVIQIDDSRPAPEFVPVAVPRNWTASNPRLTIPARPNLADSQSYREFFQPLVDDLREMGFTDKAEAEPEEFHGEHFQRFPSGIHAEWSFISSFDDKGAWTYLQWSGTSTGMKRSNEVCAALEVEKENIKAEIGSELKWNNKQNTSFFQVALGIPGSIDDPPERQDEIRAWMLETLPKFREVFNPRLEKILADLETE